MYFAGIHCSIDGFGAAVKFGAGANIGVDNCLTLLLLLLLTIS